MRDRAGIEDDEVGRSGVAYRNVTVVRERGFDGGAIGLGCATAEALNEDTLHHS
jgi:hypothetical protein